MPTSTYWYSPRPVHSRQSLSCLCQSQRHALGFTCQSHVNGRNTTSIRVLPAPTGIPLSTGTPPDISQLPYPANPSMSLSIPKTRTWTHLPPILNSRDATSIRLLLEHYQCTSHDWNTAKSSFNCLTGKIPSHTSVDQNDTHSQYATVISQPEYHRSPKLPERHWYLIHRTNSTGPFPVK